MQASPTVLKPTDKKLLVEFSYFRKYRNVLDVHKTLLSASVAWLSYRRITVKPYLCAEPSGVLARLLERQKATT